MSNYYASAFFSGAACFAAAAALVELIAWSPWRVILSGACSVLLSMLALFFASGPRSHI